MKIRVRNFSFAFAFSFIASFVFGQKFIANKGTLNFASVAELELIQASSKEVQGVLDVSSNQFAFQVLINTFHGFNGELQRVHFNEKYMESEIYPKAIFTGKIIEQVDLTKDGIYEVRAKGDLDIHGVKQNRIIKGKLIVKNGSIGLESDFKVPLADHNISIPKIVSQKIATEIQVSLRVSLVAQ